MSIRHRYAVLLTAALTGLCLALGAAPASAHTELVASTPGPGATVDGLVGDLTLTFVTPLVPEGSQVVVRDPQGADRAGTTSTLGQQARVLLDPLTRPGTYTVSYRAVAADGHAIIGDYQFRVSEKGAAAARAAARAAGPADADRTDSAAQRGTVAGAGPGGSSPAGLLIGGLGAGTLTVLLLAGARRRTEHGEQCS